MSESSHTTDIRAAVFAACEPKTAHVLWRGIGPVLVRQLTVKEREELDRETFRRNRRKQPAAIAERWIIATVMNADGSPMFTDLDLERLGKLPSSLATSIMAVISKENNIGVDIDEDDEGN